LERLTLADSFAESNRTVNIVIGIDYYHTIIQGEILKGSEGPVAVKSKLGWLLSGLVNNVSSEITLNTNVIPNLVLDILPSRSKVENKDRQLIESLNKCWRHESMVSSETKL